MVGGVTLFGFIVAGVGASVVLSQKPHIFRVHSELRPRLQKIGKSHASGCTCWDRRLHQMEGVYANPAATAAAHTTAGEFVRLPVCDSDRDGVCYPSDDCDVRFDLCRSLVRNANPIHSGI